jgi:hypothetical protein
MRLLLARPSETYVLQFPSNIREAYMPHFSARSARVVLAALLISAPSLAFQTPLSPEAVREAYFLGQHRDEGTARFLDTYTKPLPRPKTGPNIASVTFFTPFALLVQNSSRRSDYSSQQAELDHQRHKESVKVIVEILLTDSYGPFIPRPTGSQSGSPMGIMLRPGGFWQDFDVQVFDGKKPLAPVDSSGRPTYSCGDDGGCVLTGATIELEFMAEAFASDSATVQVDPPEGDAVSLDFNLAALR